MEKQPDFEIKSTGEISKEFLNRHISSFQQAADFVKQLAYRRNTNKQDLTTVFTNQCGTCSTKHALLKKLADENGFEGMQLIVGIFKMNAVNTPKISRTLQKHHLAYIPEAHTYLRFDNQILDFTKKNSGGTAWATDLSEEIKIEPDQITDFKITYQKNYLKKWLASDKNIPYSLEEIWMIREQCIKDLSKKE